MSNKIKLIREIRRERKSKRKRKKEKKKYKKRERERVTDERPTEDRNTHDRHSPFLHSSISPSLHLFVPPSLSLLDNGTLARDVSMFTWRRNKTTGEWRATPAYLTHPLTRKETWVISLSLFS